MLKNDVTLLIKKFIGIRLKHKQGVVWEYDIEPPYVNFLKPDTMKHGVCVQLKYRINFLNYTNINDTTCAVSFSFHLSVEFKMPFWYRSLLRKIFEKIWKNVFFKLLQWTLLNAIKDNIISWLIWSIWLRLKSQSRVFLTKACSLAYCEH
jgi:hypothetical protein